MKQFVALSTLLLIACGSLDPLINDAQEAVKRRLRDPESAQFRDVRRCDKPNAVHGEVNARNGYGGYAGFSAFFYANGEVAFLSAGDGLGPFASFDADQWERLRRLCYSDDVLRKADAESVNFMDSLDAPSNEVTPPTPSATAVEAGSSRDDFGEGEESFPSGPMHLTPEEMQARNGQGNGSAQPAEDRASIENRQSS